MKLMTFAAGLAAGYVLGTKAGRERYEQIVSAFNRAGSHPVVAQARHAATDAVTTGTDALASKLNSDTPGDVSPRPRRGRTQATVTAPSVTVDPAPEA
jgi:hypothetical protein